MPDNSPLLKSRTEKLLTLLVIAVIAAFFAVFSFINFCGFAVCASPDMYEDTLVAKLMWENKTLFPDSYIFGNQFYVAATPVLAALFYGLTGSVNTGMALATTLMSVLIFLSFIWMLRPAVKNTLCLLAGFLALCACVFSPGLIGEDRGQLFFVMCSYYACYLITLFFVFGDYLRARNGGNVRGASLALSLFLSFAMGMQSLRQTCIMVLPLLAFEALCLFAGFLREKRFPSGEKMPLFRVCLYAAANAAGLLFIKLLDIPHETIYTEPPYASRLAAVWHAIRSVTGFDTVLNTKNPLFALMFVFWAAVLLFAAYLVLFRFRKGNRALNILWLLCLISIAAVIAASLLTSVTIRDIYLFIYFPLLALSLIIVFCRFGARGKTVLVTALCLLSICNLHLSYKDSVEHILSFDSSPGREICEYALENGYEYVYGQDVSAPLVAVWSDGKLIAGVWEKEVVFKRVPYINVSDIYTLDDYEKALFVFIDEELPQAKIETEGNGAVLTEVGRFGTYIVCTSSKQLMYPLTWIWE